MPSTMFRLAVAEGARDVANALCAHVEGSVRAMAVWQVGGAEAGLLKPLGARGVPEATMLHARPRTAGAPLWRCVESRVLTALDLPELAELGVGVWQAAPLIAEGRVAGVALVGSDHGAPAPLAALLERVGPILARALAADRNRQQAQLFEQLASLTADGVIVATLDGVVLTYNEALERITGWTVADVRQVGWTNLVYADPVERAEAQSGIAALTLGRPSEGVVRTLARKDGTAVRTAIWSRLGPDPAGGAPAMLGVMRDVTTEEAARRHALRDEGLSRLGRLASGIAHEFNNLLCAMMGHAELVAMTPGLPASAAAHAETIVQGAQRGANLSGQLLAFSGAANVRSQPGDLGALVAQAVDLWRPRLGAGVTVDVWIDEIPLAEFDADRVQQVLVNLFANAGDAMGATGRLTVEVARATPPAVVRFRAPDAPVDLPMARVRVRDTGPGFSADALAHLFEPFYTAKSLGHGIGLPAVRGLVAAHRGAIDVSAGPGAVVDVYLPFSDRPELALPELVRDVGARGERVWVVDDQPQVLEFTRISLESHGYLVRVFSGVQPVTGARPPHPDVLVLDVVMADGGGPAALARLREAGVGAPVVWISGHTPDALELPEQGVFLQKPFTGRDLAAVVRRLLDTASPAPRAR